MNDLIGTVIGDRYVLEEHLGSGAMGRVYRARHLKINRQFAVKLLHPHLLAEAKTVKRFEQEADLAGTLDHPNVVGVLDVGQSEHGYYLVMELATGVPLTHVLASAPLVPEHALDLLAQICDGLHHAHEHGQIHRDLKPDNVMVSDRSNGSQLAKICDFGIATMRDDAPTTGKRERLTTEGLVLGTPQYMAPEIATGRPYDHRVDLFALGVIAYEMLTAKLPFDGDGVDVVRANISRATPAMGSRVPTVTVDPLLEAFTAKCMAKDPHDRPGTALAARQLLDLIETDRIAAARALGVDEPIAEPAPEPEPMIAEPARVPRSRTTTTAIAALIERSRRRTTRVIIAVAAGLALVAVAAAVAVLSHNDPAPTVVFVAAPPPPPAPPVLPPSEPIDRQSDPARTPTDEVPLIPAPPTTPAPTPARPAPHRETAAPPVKLVEDPTVEQLTQMYVAVGKHLRAHPDDTQWTRYRRIRIQDAIVDASQRSHTAQLLAQIDRALPR